MKNLQALLICLLLSNYLVGQNQCGAYTWFNFEDSTYKKHLSIDSGATVTWEIGELSGSILQAAKSKPNSLHILKDTSVNVLDSTSFILECQSSFHTNGHYLACFSADNNMHLDSGKEYVVVEATTHRKPRWISIIPDQIGIIWWGEDPVLTEVSGGWKSFSLRFDEIVAPAIQIEEDDTIRFRFTYSSDSIKDNFEEFQFDNIGFEDLITGVQENKGLVELEVYPNPFTNTTSLRTGNYIHGMVHYEIVNGYGKAIAKGSFKGDQEIDLENIAPGVYIIRLQYQTESQIRRLIKL